jgi:superfamily II DNA or RNA helicase
MSVRIVMGPGRAWVYGDAPHGELSELLAIETPGVQYAIAKAKRAVAAADKARAELEAQKGKFSFASGAPVTVPTVSAKDRRLALWDGKRRLYTQTRGAWSYPTGLTNRVLDLLEAKGLACKVERQIPSPFPYLSYRELSAAPRPHQDAAASIGISHRRGIIQMATGGGKTNVAADIFRRSGVPGLMLVHTRDLLYQAIERFASLLYEGDISRIGQIGDGQVRLRPITVATMQSVCAALNESYEAIDDEGGVDDLGFAGRQEGPFLEWWGLEAGQDPNTYRGPTGGPWRCTSPAEAVHMAVRHAGAILVDECQHAACSTVLAILKHVEDASYLLGLSATPWRDDGQDLVMEGALADPIYSITASELIDLGLLMKPDIEFIKVPTIDAKEKNFQAAFLREISDNPYQIEHVVNLAPTGRALVLVKYIEQGRRLASLIPGATFLSGKDPTHKRRQILRDVLSGHCRALVATSLADEGLDLPPLDLLLDCAEGKSTTRAHQRLGRIIRLFEGKDTPRYFGFYHGHHLLKRHCNARINALRQEPRFGVTIA